MGDVAAFAPQGEKSAIRQGNVERRQGPGGSLGDKARKHGDAGARRHRRGDRLMRWQLQRDAQLGGVDAELAEDRLENGARSRALLAQTRFADR